MSPERRRLVEALYEALLKYRPGTYPGTVTLYRARAGALLSSHTFDKGWGRLASGGVEVRVVPGNHRDLYEEPHAHALARKMREDLAAVEARLRFANTELGMP